MRQSPVPFLVFVALLNSRIFSVSIISSVCDDWFHRVTFPACYQPLCPSFLFPYFHSSYRSFFDFLFLSRRPLQPPPPPPSLRSPVPSHRQRREMAWNNFFPLTTLPSPFGLHPWALVFVSASLSSSLAYLLYQITPLSSFFPSSLGRGFCYLLCEASLWAGHRKGGPRRRYEQL